MLNKVSYRFLTSERDTLAIKLLYATSSLNEIYMHQLLQFYPNCPDVKQNIVQW